MQFDELADDAEASRQLHEAMVLVLQDDLKRQRNAAIAEERAAGETALRAAAAAHDAEVARFRLEVEPVQKELARRLKTPNADLEELFMQSEAQRMDLLSESSEAGSRRAPRTWAATTRHSA
jgi:hypothetical protein